LVQEKPVRWIVFGVLMAPGLGACGNSPYFPGNFTDAQAPVEASMPEDTSTNDTRLNLGDGAPHEGTTTCAEAEAAKSYIGCDYWPTVLANSVWSTFDFTVVVANTQGSTAEVTVTGPGGVHKSTSVNPNSLAKIYLPWVRELKGPDANNCGGTPLFSKSVLARAAAYHLVSSVPVTVYQFNALEFKGTGGAPGKDWTDCPGNFICETAGEPVGCYSFTNDASLLIPSTAMTGNYRVGTQAGTTAFQEGGYFAVTATQDGTDVTVGLSSTAAVVAGNGVAATGAGGTLTFSLNAGDVVQILGAAEDAADLSGSLVEATKPVEVFAGMQCAEEPWGAFACDHLESSVLPAETLGTDYVVTVPTSPHAKLIGHVVRFYGNVDGTTLTYSPTQPAGCPSTLNAGQVVQCTGTPSCPFTDDTGKKQTASCVTDTFEVVGSHEFAVASFMLGGSVVDREDSAQNSQGDPSMSPMVATEQYRKSYIFLAPTDYDESFTDVVIPKGTSLTLDGYPVDSTPTDVNGSWSVVRIELTNTGEDGAHVLTGTKPFGVQVIGYGAYTSYQYPAGLDLVPISPPPPPIK
jgi:IgGFc binding protein